jgi:enoyl-CoA hydratase/carnithine racemase
MDILACDHNFVDAMEHSALADFNHRSNDEWRHVNQSETGASSSLYCRRTGDTLVVSKSRAGFNEEAVRRLSGLLSAIASGEIAGLKYLVFDFRHGIGGSASERSEAFEKLIAANAELILSAPVISIAWARSDMRGADLEFALSCSMIVATRGVRFCFDGDSVESFGLYNALAQKMGFVKAERILENGEALSADDMHAHFLVKEVVERDDSPSGIERYVEHHARRYNASFGIFRAQRMSMGSWACRRPDTAIEMPRAA